MLEAPPCQNRLLASPALCQNVSLLLFFTSLEATQSMLAKKKKYQEKKLVLIILTGVRKQMERTVSVFLLCCVFRFWEDNMLERWRVWPRDLCLHVTQRTKDSYSVDNKFRL